MLARNPPIEDCGSQGPENGPANDSDKDHTKASTDYKYHMRAYEMPKGYPGEMRDDVICLSGDEEAVGEAMFKHIEYICTTFYSGRYLMFRIMNPDVSLYQACEMLHERLVDSGLIPMTWLDWVHHDMGMVGLMCSRIKVQEMIFDLMVEAATECIKHAAAGISDFSGEEFESLTQAQQDERIINSMMLTDYRQYTILDGLPGEMHKNIIMLPGNRVRVADGILKHFKHVASITESNRFLEFRPMRSNIKLKSINDLVMQGLKDTEIGTRTRLERVDEDNYTLSYVCGATKHEAEVHRKLSDAFANGILSLATNIPGLNVKLLNKVDEWLGIK